MIKKLGTIIMLFVLVCSLTACGWYKNKTEDAENSSTSAGQTDNQTTSGKKKYKNIGADTKPIGVDNISMKLNNDEVYIFCTVHKNGGDLEESFVEVTLELFDENNEYIGEKTLKTSRSLCVDDSETIKKSFWEFWGISDGKYSDYSDEDLNKALSKYKTTVVAIKETDAAEVREAEALAGIMSNIEWKIKYDEEYYSALAMLEMAKEEYPDNKELKLFEAKIKDILKQKGIDMEGNPIVEDTESEYVESEYIE